MQSEASIATRFQPGQRVPGAGRRQGSKNRFSSEFVEALAADFAKHGAELIAKVRHDDPAAYMRVCAQLVPKEFLLAVEDQRTPLSGEEWQLITAVLKAVREALPDANEREPQDVLSFVLNALKAANAKLIEPDFKSRDTKQDVENKG
jgi:hypothetical protein